MSRLLMVTFFLKCMLAQAESGLFPVDHAKIPQQLRKVSSSVVQIVTLSSEPTKVVSNDKYAFYLEKLPKIGFFENLIAERIQKCMDQNLKKCEIYYDSIGSGFLAESGDTLWTARHVLENLFGIDPEKKLGPSERYKLAREIHPQLLVYDQNRKLIFNSTKEGTDSATITGLGDFELYAETSKSSAFSDESFFKPAFDFARLHLSRKISKDFLKLEKTLPTFRESVYVFGYPVATENRSAKFKTPDADGFGLRASIGKRFLATQGNYSSRDGSSAALRRIDDLVASMLLIHDADAVPGQSGGPIVNSKGNVVAIFTNHASTDSDSSPEDDYSARGGEGPHIPWLLDLFKKMPQFGNP